jgi:hypothetical protein
MLQDNKNVLPRTSQITYALGVHWQRTPGHRSGLGHILHGCEDPHRHNLAGLFPWKTKTKLIHSRR